MAPVLYLLQDEGLLDFLTALRAVLLLLLWRFRTDVRSALKAELELLAIAGWWCVRNVVTTVTISGLAESVTLRGQGAPAMLAATPHIPWARGVDVMLTSHLYFCGWSSLTVRSWMYNLFLAAAAAVMGLIPPLRRAPVLQLASIYGFFWLGQLYSILLQF